MKASKDYAIKEIDIAQFVIIQAAIEGFHTEMSILSKPKPDNPVNPFKLGLINATLRKANSLLTDSELPLEGFKEFATEALPSNSDVVMVLSQYMEALETWRAARITYSLGHWYWQNQGTIETYPPKRLPSR